MTHTHSGCVLLPHGYKSDCCVSFCLLFPLVGACCYGLRAVRGKKGWRWPATIPMSDCRAAKVKADSDLTRAVNPPSPDQAVESTRPARIGRRVDLPTQAPPELRGPTLVGSVLLPEHKQDGSSPAPRVSKSQTSASPVGVGSE